MKDPVPIVDELRKKPHWASVKFTEFAKNEVFVVLRSLRQRFDITDEIDIYREDLDLDKALIRGSIEADVAEKKNTDRRQMQGLVLGSQSLSQQHNIIRILDSLNKFLDDVSSGSFKTHEQLSSQLATALTQYNKRESLKKRKGNLLLDRAFVPALNYTHKRKRCVMDYATPMKVMMQRYVPLLSQSRPTWPHLFYYCQR